MCGVGQAAEGQAVSVWSGPVHPQGLGWICREGKGDGGVRGMFSFAGCPGDPMLRRQGGNSGSHGSDTQRSLFFSPVRGYLSLGTHFVSKNLRALNKSVKKDFLFAQNQHTPRAFSMAPRAPTAVHESVCPGRAISLSSEQRRKCAHRNHHGRTAPGHFIPEHMEQFGQFGCKSMDTE